MVSCTCIYDVWYNAALPSFTPESKDKMKKNHARQSRPPVLPSPEINCFVPRSCCPFHDIQSYLPACPMALTSLIMDIGILSIASSRASIHPSKIQPPPRNQSKKFLQSYSRPVIKHHYILPPMLTQQRKQRQQYDSTNMTNACLSFPSQMRPWKNTPLRLRHQTDHHSYAKPCSPNQQEPDIRIFEHK